MLVTYEIASARDARLQESTMKKFAIAAVAGALSTAALGFAGAANAVPQPGGSAADTISRLQAEGYNIQISGNQSAPLSQCTILNLSGLRGTEAGGTRINPSQSDTAFVEVSCPTHD
jgi:hypothetical protein